MSLLKLQMQMTIDGFIAGPNGEMDWMTWDWDEELKQAVTELTEPIAAILLGRGLAEGFIPHWEAQLDQPDSKESGAEKFIETPKVVFTKSLSKSKWNNTSIASGDLRKEITQLKNQYSGDLMVYGGGAFVSSLVKEKLIDEFNLFVNPVLLGAGTSIFQNIKEIHHLKLQHSQPFKCGIVLQRYVCKE